MAVLTLAEAMNHLNLSGNNTNEAELVRIIASSEAVIAHHCGPLEPTTATVRVQGPSSAFVLNDLPVLSLTSVTPFGGISLPLADLYLDVEAGIVTYNTGVGFCAPFYDLVYQYGWETIPPDLMDGLKELVRHRWTTSQRPTHALTTPVNPATYLLPYLVQSLIAPYVLEGFA